MTLINRSENLNRLITIAESEKGLLLGYANKVMNDLGLSRAKIVDAGDIVNEVLLIACDKAQSNPNVLPRDRAALVAWLLRSIVYVCLNTFRRHRIEQGALSRYADLLTEEEIRQAVEARPGELRRDVDKFRASLPSEDQELLRLALYEHYTSREIGDTLQLSHDTVRQRKHRLLSKLRQYLNQ